MKTLGLKDNMKKYKSGDATVSGEKDLKQVWIILFIQRSLKQPLTMGFWKLMMVAWDELIRHILTW